MDTKKFDEFDNQSFHKFSSPSVIEKDLQTLVGIIKGIKGDKVINDTENKEIYEWINRHKQYENRQPYKEVIEIIREAFSDGVLTSEESENIVWFCNQYIEKSDYYDVITSGIQKLTGIIKGISIDNEINIEELEYLDEWLEENEYLKNTWPYDELYSLTIRIIQDRSISPDEHEALLNFCKALVDDSSHASNSNLINSLKTGFYQIDPSINIQENTFCITGLSKRYKRKEIAEKIELYGGFVVNNVSSKLNYLVVCDEKNSCWAFTCYGRKIEEAIRHRKDGKQLIIIHEFDLYDALESLA
jgi:NAD-dependent DNA ligase